MSRSEKITLMKKKQLRKKDSTKPLPPMSAPIPDSFPLGIITEEETEEEILEPLIKKPRKEASSSSAPPPPASDQQVDPLQTEPLTSNPSSSNMPKPRTLWPQSSSDPFPYDLLERFILPADNDRFKNYSPD